MRDVNAAVFGNRVMNGTDDGQAHIAHIKHAIAQRLIVMHDVILVDFIAHIIGHTHPECIGFWKTTPIMAPPFEQIGFVADNLAFKQVIGFSRAYMSSEGNFIRPMRGSSSG